VVVETVDEWATRPPAPVLARFVSGYCGYRQSGLGPSRHRGLPSPCLTLIFTLDDPLVVAEHPDPAQPPETYRCLVGGLHTRPALITHGGSQSGVQLSLSPLGARAVLGVPAGELAGQDLHASAVLGPFADQVQDRLQSARSWSQRFAVLDQLLVARLERRPGPGPGRPGAAGRLRPEVVRAWQQILASAGRVGVRDLAAEVGCSPRHLGELFRSEIGLAPKAAARVARFDRARRRLQAEQRPGTLADLAADCGYYDQSHLNRDFRSLAGAAPLEWLAAELRNVQVPPTEVLAALPA
jgi:AraC-like DNA-binding protein